LLAAQNAVGSCAASIFTDWQESKQQMAIVTLQIPMITAVGASKPSQISREFRGVMPAAESVAFVARIVRDGLESAV